MLEMSLLANQLKLELMLSTNELKYLLFKFDCSVVKLKPTKRSRPSGASWEQERE